MNSQTLSQLPQAQTIQKGTGSLQQKLATNSWVMAKGIDYPDDTNNFRGLGSQYTSQQSQTTLSLPQQRCTPFNHNNYSSGSMGVNNFWPAMPYEICGRAPYYHFRVVCWCWSPARLATTIVLGPTAAKSSPAFTRVSAVCSCPASFQCAEPQNASYTTTSAGHASDLEPYVNTLRMCKIAPEYTGFSSKTTS